MNFSRRAVSLVLVLGAGTLPALAPPATAVPLSPLAPAAVPLPCLQADGPKDYRTTPPLVPGGSSHVDFWLPRSTPSEEGPDRRTVSRPDGSQVHSFPVTGGWSSGGPLWVGTDMYNYTLPDMGTWVIRDVAAQPLHRWTVKAASWFSSITGPGRIVTAGETITVKAQLVGWTATGARAAVHGMPIDVLANTPAGTFDFWRRVPTQRDGTISVSLRMVSNRRIDTSATGYGCYTHAGRRGPELSVLVRKRITVTPATTTPRVGQSIKVSGTVYPGRENEPVYLQRWNGSSFVTVTPGRTSGSYTFYYRPTTRGSHILRVYTAYDSSNVSSGSPNVRLTVG